MLNHTIIMGRLTKDPELRHTNSGVPVASFTIACDRDFSNKESGEKEVDFIDVVAWRSTAEFVSKYFTKGRMAVASGRLQIRTWTDKDGNKRRNAEVQAENVYFADSKKEDSGFAQTYSAPAFGNAQFSASEKTFANVQASDYARTFADAQAFPVMTDPDEGLPF